MTDLARIHRHRQEQHALTHYQYDTTDSLHTLYPGLRHVWDELDELRTWVHDSVPFDEHQEVERHADRLLKLAERCAARIDTLVSDYEMDPHVQTVLENVADLLDGRTEE